MRKLLFLVLLVTCSLSFANAENLVPDIGKGAILEPSGIQEGENLQEAVRKNANNSYLYM